MLNVLSVDVEEYFHVEAFAAQIPYQSWDQYTPRVERNVERLLELFARYGVRGTFFTLGWVSERMPHLVRKIAEAGHEVGCHSYAHRRLHRLTPDQFRDDLRAARSSLMEQVQKPVVCFRAPSFSIVKKTLWAFDILAEEGFEIDSSVFPVHHDNYGMPKAQRSPGWYVTPAGNAIFEFPPSTVRLMGNNLGVGGGGYLRLFPYALTRWALRRLNEKERRPAMVYVHPWEIDPAQPRIPAPLKSRLRHYTNLATMETKIESLLRDFRFAPLSEVCQLLDVYHKNARHPGTGEVIRLTA